MKELNIRHQLIHDIRFLSPELLSQAFHYFELLKFSDNNKKSTWKTFVGCISDKEAINQKEIIDKEFENIEGEWKAMNTFALDTNIALISLMGKRIFYINMKNIQPYIYL